MSRSILFYPTINKKMLKSLNCQIEDFQSLYSRGSETYALKCNFEEEAGINYLSIVDDTGRWSPEQFNISFSGTLSLHKSEVLFGKNGIVPEGAVIGIGMLWKSKSSNFRGAEKLGIVDSSSGELHFPFHKTFESASLRGTIELTFQLFVQDSGENDCFPKGVSLGEVLAINIILEGINSTFTVFEKSAPGEPLWNVDCDWDDPGYDPFSESVRVTINTAHPAWALTVDEEVRKELLKEIMASSMQVVISELDDEHLDITEEYTPGSVCDAITYIISRADLKMESAATIAKSIRAYLDKSMK